MQERYSPPPRPEYFEQAQSLNEAMNEYNSLMDGVVQEHETRFSPIATEHQTTFANELQTPGSQDIDGVLANTSEAVQSSLEPTVATVREVVTAASEAIPRFLSGHDQQVLAQAKRAIANYGVGSRFVEDTLRKASDEQSKAAIRAALDDETLKQLAGNVQNYGVNSRFIQETLRLASSQAVQSSMRASLDADVFRRLQADINTYGVTSRFISETLKSASSTNVKAALRATLDADVLKHLESDIRTYGADSRYVTGTLKHASSEAVRQVFAKKTQAGFSGQQGSRSNSKRGDEGASYGYESFGENTSYEDFLRNMFRDRGSNSRGGAGQQGYQTPPRQPRREAPRQQPDRDIEAEQVVSNVIAGNRQYSWLRGEDPQSVRRVINTVRKLRTQALEKGEPISDRDIYMKYRRGADKGEVGGKDVANPAVVKSFQILDAMMGSDIRGKLPF